MGGMSIWHWIIVGGVLLLLFGGKGKISDLMGDFAKGIKSFKKGMADDDDGRQGRRRDADRTGRAGRSAAHHRPSRRRSVETPIETPPGRLTRPSCAASRDGPARSAPEPSRTARPFSAMPSR